MHGQIGMEDILFIPLFQQIFHKQKYLCGSCGIQKHRQRYLGAVLPNPVSGTRQINLYMGCGTSEAGKTPQSFTNWTKTWRVLTCGDIQGWEKNCRGSNFLRGNPSISLKHKQKNKVLNTAEIPENTSTNQHQRQHCTGLNYQVTPMNAQLPQCCRKQLQKPFSLQ